MQIKKIINYSTNIIDIEVQEKIQEDSKLLSGFPFVYQGVPDNNLESSCIKSNRLGMNWEKETRKRRVT
jgi:hypothetical protein